jgi:hypothetical protein
MLIKTLLTMNLLITLINVILHILSEMIFQQKSSNVKININDVCNLINAPCEQIN